MLRITLCLFAILAVETAAAVEVHVQYLRQEIDAPPTLSNLDEEPDDLGLAGARVGLNDNRTTGSFLGQTYELGVTSLPPGRTSPKPQTRRWPSPGFSSSMRRPAIFWPLRTCRRPRVP